MKKFREWIIVEHKFTYIFLAILVIGLIKLLFGIVQFFVFQNVSATDFGGSSVLSLIAILFGFYFFIKFNTYSAIMNPNHPKSKSTTK